MNLTVEINLIIENTAVFFITIELEGELSIEPERVDTYFSQLAISEHARQTPLSQRYE